MQYKKIFIMMHFLLFIKIIHTSPVPASCGGTGLTSMAPYGVVCGGTSSIDAFQNVSGVGSSGQGLMSNGLSALPSWENVLPGYTVSTTFGYIGGTSTLAASPNFTMLCNTVIPASITSSSNYVTSMGYNSLNALTSAGDKILAIGTNALNKNTSYSTTAVGYNALASCTSGIWNVALGTNSLSSLSTNIAGIGIGTSAGANSNGIDIVVVGHQALNASTHTRGGVACGYQAGLLVNDGAYSICCGYQVLSANVSGDDNTAFGYQALISATGSQNVAVGSKAGGTGGSALTSGDNNIYLGYNATPISTTESNTIVIGNTSHSTAYCFGINGTITSGGVSALINSSYKLGTTTSTKMVKDEIKEVSESQANKLLDTSVVKFNYKEDETAEMHYGLLAEDLEPIFPELVCYDENGEIWTIRYEQFIPLLIKQFQLRHKKIESLKRIIANLEQEIAALQ